ncbi:MAG: glycosyl hydrolase 108 family protein [Pseudomonadota bacterium]|nr:glycosyl hydrolase 108 family protein [Pseudomonadota bacterium]MED5423638.1 glycosyl hydrolase 108 family protein [Pseudomonadota bacterium]
MSLFGKFEHPLKSNVGSNHTNDPDDIIKTKRHLNKLGYFVEDTEGPFITKAMENGIIKYQKDNNLRIDGVMKPGGETQRSMFEVLTKKPADILWDYKEDDSVGIGFGGNVTGTLPPRKVPKIRDIGIVPDLPKPKEAPQPPPTQAERVLGSIDAITAAISAAKGNTKRSRENRGVFKTAEILARVHEEAKRRKEQNMMSISAEKQGTKDSAMAKPVARPADEYSGTERIPVRPKSRPERMVRKNTDLPEFEQNDIFGEYRARLEPREGGYADRPKSEDPAGATMKGVSQATLEAMRKIHPEWNLPEKTIDLTDQETNTVFRDEYFERPKIDKLANVPGLKESGSKIAEHVFDSGVLHGPADAGRWLQESLDEVTGTDLKTNREDGGAYYDGNIGPATRQAVEAAVRSGKIKEVGKLYAQKREEFMRGLDNFDSNKGGWLARKNELSD